MGAMAVAGVLIWSKLRLATDIPRSAYAVPEQTDDAEARDTGADPETDAGNGGDTRGAADGALIGPERD